MRALCVLAGDRGSRGRQVAQESPEERTGSAVRPRHRESWRRAAVLEVGNEASSMETVFRTDTLRCITEANGTCP